MRAAILAVVIFWCAPAVAQAPQPEKTIALSATLSEVQVIMNELGKMPWRDINPLMTKLIGQINAQMAPPPPPNPAPTNPPPSSSESGN